jgi:hypothetical protein
MSVCATRREKGGGEGDGEREKVENSNEEESYRKEAIAEW